MAFNPAKQTEALNSPVERASKLNDPQFENQQGYFPYDLTHQEFITPLFGQITPTMHLDTVPGDRTVVHDNTKLILNQINGNFLSNLNQYVDSFYVPLRNVFPNNYEKLIPNPVKGEDLPNSALPVVPLLAYIRSLYRSEASLVFDAVDTTDTLENLVTMVEESQNGDIIGSVLPSDVDVAYLLGRLTLTATVLSRGQLLDYLGFQLDTPYLNSRVSSELQKAIDDYFRALWTDFYNDRSDSNGVIDYVATSAKLSLTSDAITTTGNKETRIQGLEDFRSWIADSFERGEMPLFNNAFSGVTVDSIRALISTLDQIFSGYTVDSSASEQIKIVDGLTDVNSESNINIGKILAYQQVVAHYYTNDKVDNIYSSELFMQNLRSIMYPTEEGSITTTEPTFDMNGVRYEYDYISYGGFVSSLLSDELMPGSVNRQYVWATVMLLMRRSLRFGDYFSTARPNMLAVSDQLGIAVDGGQVSPIDVTKNLLMQRYLNAANYIGQGFLQYMSSIYGIKPSDTGCIPRFISHRKIALQNQITNNTADNQGAQTTNIVGYSDMSAFDVFIDDFGYLISLTSFDVLPVYKSGIENTYHFSDRFDYFNPMLQGIGDQAIRSSELLGYPELYGDTFGYTMRNAEYKYKLSKAHGAFCNSLPGFMISYPLYAYNESVDGYDLDINPDFIRDKPIYLDPVVPQMTGISPAEYFHFIVSCTNQVHCARKIQATPGVLF